ncbi:leucine-rich repeat domain-containing protein [Chitinophaga arvensicola]|uniref:Leucine Rich repeat-containing protein n=1 Tax=Chitinophaga arvensicola TaxID=29529 RepID=A0A1I0SC02_9BACT|nr:hypothetical protein [Chitinophaga arvensicola]SEW54493.1 hypothetical protein SAMN04488122_6053 [Chitinophaga arvensicola]
MEKYQVDYSQFSYFKGIRILFAYLQEGLDYAQENNIRDVCVWTDGDWDKQLVDFEFLKGRDFITTFHWLVPLKKKSVINGIYHLSGVTDLRWGGASDFDLDLSKFPSLKRLNIGYGEKIKGWEKVKTLEWLQIGGIKTTDLSFLKEIIQLEYLRIIGASITSIAGIEKCSKLKTLFLQKCTSLVDMHDTLKELPHLTQLNLEGCKKVNTVTALAGIEIKNVSVL